MKKKHVSILLALLLFFTLLGLVEDSGYAYHYHPNNLPDSLIENETRLAVLMNEYRTSLGLEPFSVSKYLTKVARYHVYDSSINKPYEAYDVRGIKGNLHSWSDKGHWLPVVYTSDHEYASLMWSKPSELTNYTDYGYEISAKSTGNLTPEKAIELWKNSPAHNDVIVGTGFWSRLKTMGIGINGNYSHVWFGIEDDPDGYYLQSEQEILTLTATATGQNSVNLSWSGYDLTGFAIERKTAGTSFQQVTTVGPGASSYTDTGLATNTTYTYRIRSIDTGQYSNETSVTTGTWWETFTLTATATGQNSVSLSWTGNDQNGFAIERRTAGTTYQQIASVSSEVSSYTDTGLVANTTYFYRIRAVDTGAISNEASVTTPSVIDDDIEWKTWEPQVNMPPDKTWTIQFNKTLDISTIKERNIYVTDKHNQIVPMFYYQEYQDIDKKIYIVPVRDYAPGETYTLWIKDLKAKDGTVLPKCEDGVHDKSVKNSMAVR